MSFIEAIDADIRYLGALSHEEWKRVQGEINGMLERMRTELHFHSMRYLFLREQGSAVGEGAL